MFQTKRPTRAIDGYRRPFTAAFVGGSSLRYELRTNNNHFKTVFERACMSVHVRLIRIVCPVTFLINVPVLPRQIFARIPFDEIKKLQNFINQESWIALQEKMSRPRPLNALSEECGKYVIRLLDESLLCDSKLDYDSEKRHSSSYRVSSPTLTPNSLFYNGIRMFLRVGLGARVNCI